MLLGILTPCSLLQRPTKLRQIEEESLDVTANLLELDATYGVIVDETTIEVRLKRRTKTLRNDSTATTSYVRWRDDNSRFCNEL